MNLIKDFWTYCSCYEVPKNYAYFSALTLLSACLHRKCFYMLGDTPITTVLYCTLVGEQGSKKSTPTDFARDIFHEVYPDIPTLPSVQSREDLIKFMASKAGTFFYQDHNNVEVEYHPYMGFINELEMFISFNPTGMVSFLVDMHDRKFYSSSTLKRGLEAFPNPALSFLACCTPNWLIDKLRGGVMTGGICRRMLFCYEGDAKTIDGELVSICDPVITDEARAARNRVIDHLKFLKDSHFAGEYIYTPAGKLFINEWYNRNKRTLPDDPVLRGYRRSKDIQLRRLAMLMDASCPKPTFKLSDELFMIALETLDSLEENLPKLSIAAGRNELAVPQQELLEALQKNGGYMDDKEWHIKAGRNLTEAEYQMVLRMFKDTQQIFAMQDPDSKRNLIVNAETYMKWIQAGKVDIKRKEK